MVGFVKAAARRGLALMLGLAEGIDTSIAEAVRACAATATPGPGPRAARLNITRQAAQQRGGAAS